MNYEIHSQPYVALRAVPIITGGALDAATLAHMISSPEGFCDADEHSEVVSPVMWDGISRWLPVRPALFAGVGIAKRPQPEFYGAGMLLPGMAVSMASVLDKYNLVSGQPSLRQRRRRLARGANMVLDWAPTLTAAQRALILQGLPPERANSAAATRHQLRVAFDTITAACARQGLNLNPRDLPGGVKHWLPYLSKLSPGVPDLAIATIKDHLHEIGLRWRQGAQRAAISQWKDALTKSGL